MVLLSTPKLNLGWQAADFSLKNIDNNIISLSNINRDAKPFIIMFICNHCPYVKKIANKLSESVKFLNQKINFVAINSNDSKKYPEDSFTNMKLFAKENIFTFPYLIDENQEVAKNYGAVCTPDFFGFNSKGKLQYRGRFCDPNKLDRQINDFDLVKAMLEIEKHDITNIVQYPSIGCSIKWKE